MTTNTTDETYSVPDRYQIPCGDCTLTDFWAGNSYVKGGIGSLWLLTAGAVGFTLSVLLVLLQHRLGMWGATLSAIALGGGFIGLFATTVVHTGHQLSRDMRTVWKTGMLPKTKITESGDGHGDSRPQ